jgi:hypothetical protein
MSNKASNPACEAVTGNGRPCLAKAQKERSYCFFHDPAEAEKRRAAQVRGGQGNHKTMVPMTSLLESVPVNKSDLIALYAAMINGIFRAELHPNSARAVGYIANGMAKAMDDRDLREQLRDLQEYRRESSKEAGLFDPWARRGKI